MIPVAAPASAPQVTLLVELGASLDYPYALAASLAGRSDVVLMLHHPDRRALAALRAMGEELHAIYGIGVELFDIAEEDLLPAERLRAAVASAGTDAVIFLSGDVLPQQRSWLEPWLAQLSRPEPVLAGAAVFGHDTGARRSRRAPPGATCRHAARRLRRKRQRPILRPERRGARDPGADALAGWRARGGHPGPRRDPSQTRRARMWRWIRSSG